MNALTRIFYLVLLGALAQWSYVRAETKLPQVPIKVGVIVPLTGEFADFGIATQNGIQIARSTGSPSMPIEFIFEDSRYDPKAAVAALYKLHQIDHVHLVFNWGTGPNQAAAPIAERIQLPLLAMTTEGSVSTRRKFVLRFSTYADQYSALLLEYLRARRYSRVALFHSEVAYFNEVIAGLRRGARKGEVFEDVSTFPPSETDFRSMILKLKHDRYDALGIFLVNGQLTPFFSQLAAMHIRLPVIGSNTFDSRADIARTGTAMLGAVYPTISTSQEFRERYLTTFNNDIQLPFAALGHDFVRLIQESITKAEDIESPEHLMSALRRVKPFVGVTGSVRYVEPDVAGPGFDFPVVLQQIGKGDL